MMTNAPKHQMQSQRNSGFALQLFYAALLSNLKFFNYKFGDLSRCGVVANEDPVMALLREIRDIQRSHAEWHRALSEQVAEEQRRRDEVAQRVAEATQAEVRKNQRDLKVLFVVFIVVLAIAGPLGNWIMHLAGR